MRSPFVYRHVLRALVCGSHIREDRSRIPNPGPSETSVVHVNEVPEW